MKKLLTALLAALPLLWLPLDSNADKNKGPSDRAYERANDNASFKRDDDSKKDKKKHKKGDRDEHRDRDEQGDRYRDWDENRKKGRFD